MDAYRKFDNALELKTALGEHQYIASDEIAIIMYLSQQLGKPILTEGPAGVGKTELAKAISGGAGLPSIGFTKGVMGVGKSGKMLIHSFGISFGSKKILALK